MGDKSVSPGRLFCIRVRSLQSPIFLAILLIGIMMLSESWCFEQKVQEKDGMEREKKKSQFPLEQLLNGEKRCDGGEF